ncbi:MAG: DUF4230 domain-containing protein [Saprospiraceae bacterium]|jgi:hypothetical protein|nr:DUF4230 domain-containing protein [Saprospiraceae bacterium]
MIRPGIKQILISAFLILGLGFAMWYYMKNHIFKVQEAESSTLVLEKIKTVTKLITVEGQFSELYNYKESYEYDFFNLFSKKIILRVTAKVSVGYDFEKVNLTVDSLTKTITLNEMPLPEILSIDHDLDYYDISQGTFNSFTADEYNMINKRAKQLIATKAKNTPLLAEAEKQKSEYIKMMEMALKSGGWQLVVKNRPAPLN